MRKSTKPTLYYGLLGVLMLMIFIAFALAGLRDLSESRVLQAFPGTQSAKNKRDCSTETIYSMTNAQCRAICKGPGLYVSRNGVCVNALAFDSASVTNQCSAKDGLLAYIVGNTQLGRTQVRCMSIDLGVQPDDLRKPNTICVNGTIDIDYVKSYPQIENCKCKEGDVLTRVFNTSVVRTRGVCVPAGMRAAFELNNLVFSGQHV